MKNLKSIFLEILRLLILHVQASGRNIKLDLPRDLAEGKRAVAAQKAKDLQAAHDAHERSKIQNRHRGNPAKLARVIKNLP